MAVVFQDAMESLLKKKSKTNLSERMSTFLEVGIEKQMSKIDKGFTFLATVGSTAPFIGLFGTVWGIMNSFQSIAISRNTSLAVVAPGIAIPGATTCLLYTSPSPRDRTRSRMPSSA